jgi:hypothetical protein
MSRLFLLKTCLTCKREFTIPGSESKKGRGKFCSRACRSRHTSSFESIEVLELLSLRKNGWTYSELSQKFKVSMSQVGHIVTGEQWGYLQDLSIEYVQ